jgi:glucan 1,3-beta-glucosidase
MIQFIHIKNIVNIFICLLPFFNTCSYAKIRGVSLGSLYVLEPFITPHLFYPFLGNQERVISDTYSLCDYLGPYKTNKLLKKHWNDWINEDIISEIYDSGINTIRIPVGDYMYLPYGSYSIVENGFKCFDGSIEHLDYILNYMKKYNFKIIIDVHAWKDSQNGFDNSGQTKNMEITVMNSSFDLNRSILYYKHWNIRSAQWVGTYDIINKEYININYQNIDHAINVIDIILDKYKNYENIWGLCPMNEPWENTPEDILKYFYKKVYDSFIDKWSYDKVLILHDSFRPYLWEDCDFIELDKNNIKIDIYLDTHQYKAWNEPVPFDTLIDSIRNWNYPKTCFPVIIGEFSLATDNCQMWLNGFMDNIPNYPLQECHYERCPRLLEGRNRNYIKNSIYGPFGTGISYPTEYGYCPITTPIELNKKISNINLDTNTNNINEDYYAKNLYKELTEVFENKTIGWIFWNFRTSSPSYSWNYLSSYNLGYVSTEFTGHIINNKLFEINSIKINYTKLISISIFFTLLFVILIIRIYNLKKDNKNIGIEYIPIKSTLNNNYNSCLDNDIVNNKYSINI